jgi:hypothetical protein
MRHPESGGAPPHYKTLSRRSDPSASRRSFLLVTEQGLAHEAICGWWRKPPGSARVPRAGFGVPPKRTSCGVRSDGARSPENVRTRAPAMRRFHSRFPLVPKVSAALWERTEQRRNSVSVAGGSRPGAAMEVVFRRTGGGVSLRRAFPKRCANFGNETKPRAFRAALDALVAGLCQSAGDRAQRRNRRGQSGQLPLAQPAPPADAAHVARRSEALLRRDHR